MKGREWKAMGGWGEGIVGVDGDAAKRRGSEGAVCGCFAVRAGLYAMFISYFFTFFFFLLKSCKEVNTMSLYP